MRRGMRNPRGLEIRYYAAHIIDINDYFSVLPRAKASDKICKTEFDKKLNSMHNSWSSQ